MSIFLEGSSENLEDHFDVRTNVKEAAEKYYGLELKKIGIDEIIDEGEKIYLARIDAAKYPLARMDETVIHWCVPYKFLESEIIISDIYYGETQYHFNKKAFLSSCEEVYEISIIDQVSELHQESIVQSLLSNQYQIYSKVLDRVNKHPDYKYDSGRLIDKLQMSYTILEKEGELWRKYNSDCLGNLYLETCADALKSVAKRFRQIWYGIVKIHLRADEVSREKLNQYLYKVENVLQLEIDEIETYYGFEFDIEMLDIDKIFNFGELVSIVNQYVA